MLSNSACSFSNHLRGCHRVALLNFDVRMWHCHLPSAEVGQVWIVGIRPSLSKSAHTDCIKLAADYAHALFQHFEQPERMSNDITWKPVSAENKTAVVSQYIPKQQHRLQWMVLAVSRPQNFQACNTPIQALWSSNNRHV